MSSPRSGREPVARPDSNDPAVESEWLRLRAELDFAKGAWFGFVFSTSHDDSLMLLSRAQDVLRQRVRSLGRLVLETVDELRSSGTDVVAMARGHDACWIDATLVRPTPSNRTSWESAWEELASHLNRQRDALLTDLGGGLILSAPPEVKPLIRSAAPDLWSMRSVVLHLPGRASRPEPLGRSEPTAAADFQVRQATIALHPNELARTAKGLLDEAAVALRRGAAAIAVQKAAGAVRTLEDHGADRDDLASALTLLSRAVEANGDPPIEPARRALDLEPSDVAVQTELLDRIGKSCLGSGQLEEARASYQDLVGLHRHLADELGTPQALRELSVSLMRLGDIDEALGDLASAREDYRQSLDLARRLADQLGTPEARRDLLVSLSRMGDVKDVSGDLASARDSYQESLELARRLADQLGTPEARRDLFASLSRMGDVEFANGDLTAARDAYRESLDLARRLADQLGTPDSLRSLAISLARLGDVERAGGDLAAARAAYQQSLDISRRLADQLATPEALRDLSVSLSRLGDVDYAEGDLASARDAYQQSLDLAGRLAHRLGTPEARRDLSASVSKLGDVVLFDRESVDIFRHLDDRLGTPQSLRGLAIGQAQFKSVPGEHQDEGALEAFDKELDDVTDRMARHEQPPPEEG